MTKERVAVIGAGVIGVMCALRLAEEGYAVTVLDQQSAGFVRGGAAASLSAAGMLAPLSEAVAHESGHAALDALGLLGYELWRSRARNAPWSGFVHFDGAAFISADDGAALFNKAKALACRATAFGQPALRQELGPAREKLPGFFIEDEGAVDPVLVYEALVTEARGRGVVFRYDFTFDGFGAFSVYDAALAPVAAEHVVIAPGASGDGYLREAVSALAHVRPAKGHLMQVECAQALRLTLHTPDFYITRRWNGDLILGATMEWGRDDLAVDPAQTKPLLEAANNFFGGGVTIKRGTSPWAGVRPMSPDGAPLIGPVRAGAAVSAFLAAGHGRNGWLLAPITAEIICAYVTGKPIPLPWAAFSPDRFGTSS